MTNERTEYVEKLMKFVIGEEVKIDRTKGQKDTTPVLGTGHLANGEGTTVKEGKREYASGNIAKSVKRDLDKLDALMEKYKGALSEEFFKEYNKLMDRMKSGWARGEDPGLKYPIDVPIWDRSDRESMPDPPHTARV